MPEIKFLVANCDDDQTQLECGGGYSTKDGNNIAIYYCSHCEGYYIAIDGEFMGGKWGYLAANDALQAHFQSIAVKQQS